MESLCFFNFVLSMNLNLKMTVERSKRRSYFLSLVFVTKCFTKEEKYRAISENEDDFELERNPV